MTLVRISIGIGGGHKKRDTEEVKHDEDMYVHKIPTFVGINFRGALRKMYY